MRYFSHLNTARQVLTNYQGNQPFGYYIREFFRANKKYGSKDRKRISQLCYGFFRLGNSCRELSIDDRILVGLFLASNTKDDLLQEMKPEWNEFVTQSLKEKIDNLGFVPDIREIFPFIENSSKEIEQDKFALSHLIQPELFIRIRPGRDREVIKKLKDHKIEFSEIGQSTIALPNSSKLEDILILNQDAVVQDYNSQQTGDFIQFAINEIKKQSSSVKVWDCCAASGGKSIMAYDIDSSIQLTVSDIRESILINLRNRLKEAGIKVFQQSVIDLTVPGAANKAIGRDKFDLIISDVPCSGSGTWGRTPEQLLFFSADQISQYANLQKKIVDNIVTRINKNGFLLYITCSVYQQENEVMIKHIQDTHSMQLVNSAVLKGYEMRADTMFAALFQSRL